MADWRIERLAGHHDRSAFDCGKPPLTDWLRQHARQHQARDLARTYVLVRPGQPGIFGYYALANCQIRYEDLPADRSKGLPRRIGIPGVLLGKLATDRSVQGKKLGAALLVNALRRVESLAGQVGIRVVLVDALDDEARGFYLRHGFESLMDDPRRLFVSIATIRGLGLPPLAD